MQGKQEVTQLEFVLVTAAAHGEEWPRPDSSPLSFTSLGLSPLGEAGSKELHRKDWEPPGRAFRQMLQLSRAKFPRSDGNPRAACWFQTSDQKHLWCWANKARFWQEPELQSIITSYCFQTSPTNSHTQLITGNSHTLLITGSFGCTPSGET